VNKEEILGMYVALEKFVSIDHKKEWKMWEDQVALIENAAKKIDGVTTHITIPPVAHVTPTLTISWDINKVKLTKDELLEKLRNGDPSIAVMGSGESSINITVWMLKPGQEKVVAKRVQEELKRASA